MVTEADVTRLTEVITTHVEAKKIILFGSYAQNTVRSDSDVDILVLVDDSVSNRREIVQLLYRKVYKLIDIPCDILVERESTFQERSVLPTIERTIVREGKVIYTV